MDLLIAKLLRGLLEVVSEFVDVADVSLDGSGRAVAKLKVFDQSLPERSHGEDSHEEQGASGGETAATILARESLGRKSF